MNALQYVLSFFDGEISAAVYKLDKDILSGITEIRIRKNNYFILVIRNTSFFLDADGEICEQPLPKSIKLSSEYVDRLFYKFCEYSVYSNENNIRQGFITLPNGARVGLTGTAVMSQNAVTNVKDISSLNIRIPHEVRGCSDSVLNCLYVSKFPSVIVAGMPSSGKTTLLRDMAFQLSNGFGERYRKVTLIDERNEFAGKFGSENMLSVGVNCDVLSSFPKAVGIELATRTLSPEMIVCDEVSRESEVEAISFAFSSGISFALSVHIGSREDLYRKPIIKKLLDTGEFSYIILLGGVSHNAEILDAEVVYDEIRRLDSCDSVNERCGRSDV